MEVGTANFKQNGGGWVSDLPATCLILCFYNADMFLLTWVLDVRLPVPVVVRELLLPVCAVSLCICSLHQPLRGTVHLVLGTYLVFVSHHESVFLSHAVTCASCPYPPPAPFCRPGMPRVSTYTARHACITAHSFLFACGVSKNSCLCARW